MRHRHTCLRGGIGWLATGDIPSRLPSLEILYLSWCCARASSTHPIDTYCTYCTYFRVPGIILAFFVLFVLFYFCFHSSFCRFLPFFNFNFYALSLELCRCSSDLFLPSRSRTTYWIGNRVHCWVWLRHDRLINLKNTHTHTQ